MPLRTKQISVRLPSSMDAWLERRAGRSRNKAGFVRQLIEREMMRERQEQLLRVFNEAAKDLTVTDREERELLLGGYAGRVD